MDSDLSLSDGNFGFAFNNVFFSDRLLRIEITHGSGEVRCSNPVDLVRDRKRRREDVNNHINVATSLMEFDQNKNSPETIKNNHINVATNQVESDQNKNSPETIKNKHEETLVMAEQEPQSGGEEENEYNSYVLTNNPSVVRVIELHITSAILAAKSPFFYKLFSNGMLESLQNHMTLKIDASEETAVMELLKFMHSNTVSDTTTPALLDVLMVADKFEVASCMNYCSRLLLKTPMTLDSALLILDLPWNLLTADSVKPLTNAATQFIASLYKRFDRITREELMALPLVGIEAILASDGLEVASEDHVYELVLRWAESHYSVLEERQEILSTHLARYIRFPHMSCLRLIKILNSNDFAPSVASKLVLQALWFKAESLDNRCAFTREQSALFCPRCVERSYVYRPIKIMEFDAPRHQCIVYLDLKRKECESIYPSNRIVSQLFPLGGQGFFLSAQCDMDHLRVFHCFGLFLGMQEKGSASLTVDYEFAVRSKPTEEFVRKFKGNYRFTGGKASGCGNLFTTPWENFLDKNCPYFINDVLHLRVELILIL